MTKPPASTPDSAQVHASALVIDCHADTPQRFVDEAWNFSDALGPGHLNLETARRGNLAAEFFAIWPEPAAWKGRSAHRALSLIDGVLEQVRRHPSDLALCTSPADILDARAAGKVAVLMGIEGGHAIESSLALLRSYYRLGVRYMTLTWANSNDWADSSGDLDDANVPHHNGLTAFGHDVIAEMNRLGMMIDISHASDKTLADVLSRHPRTGYRVALGRASPHQLTPQPHRQPTSRDRSQPRRHHGQFLRSLYRPELSPRLDRTEGRAPRC